MKTINYTGSSKTISRIVNLLNRKAPLPLDGDGDPDWGTNGQFLTTDGSGNTAWSSGGGGGDTVSWTQTQASGTKIAEIDINGTSQNVYVPTAPTVNDGTLTIQQNGTTVGTFSANQSGNTTVNLTGGGGSGGHTIENTSGTDLPQEDNLQFVGVYTRDDSGNDRTKVNIVREMTKAQMTALSSAEAEGFIHTTDEDDIYAAIDAEDVKYGGSDVKTALDGKVNRSGDTMTGMLTIDRSADDGTQRALALRSGASGITYLTLFDKANTQLGSFGCNAQNNPVFRTSVGTVKKLSTRTVTTLVDESVSIAAGGSKQYSTLTSTALLAYDEVIVMVGYSNQMVNAVISKAEMTKLVNYSSGGITGATMCQFGRLLISGGSITVDYSFGVRPLAAGMYLYNRSTTTSIDSLLIEGITY